MKLRDLEAQTNDITAREIDKPGPTRTKSAPVHQFEITERMHSAEEQVQTLTSKLEEVLANGELRKIPLSQLHEVEGRRRKLTPLEYSDLHDNLEKLGKVLDPIKVRPRKEGGYEIVSGNNKTAIARELGWPDILCRIEDISDDKATIEGFFTNLFQTRLPPYAKYEGFKKLLDDGLAVTQTDLVNLTGRKKDEVSEIMKLESLPDAVHAILQKDPNLLGLSAAADLARLSLEGHGEKVLKAVEKIGANELLQGQAVASVMAEVAEEKRANRPLRKQVEKKGPVAIKSGKFNYCSVHSNAKVLRIEFESKEEQALLESRISALLQQRADEIKGKK